MTQDFWIWVDHRQGAIEEATFGLAAEARRLLANIDTRGTVTAVALGTGLQDELQQLSTYGVNRVLYIDDDSLACYHGELFAGITAELATKYTPVFILMSHTDETADLGPRLAALLETGLVTRAMDLKIDDKRGTVVVRPVANGYLFEEVQFNGPRPFMVSFLPTVLSPMETQPPDRFQILKETAQFPHQDLQTKVVKRIEADPEKLDLEKADIIVSGGRGVGKDEAFAIIYELAKTIGGSVGGTRPIIDWQILPFERQIGQTGKSVSPRLIINCGISGANEYTAGMEKSQKVIAINTDARARIFRFADLGVMGDVHAVVPLLIARLKEIGNSS
jgi:electron transfer flavoprotein alpha subunit